MFGKLVGCDEEQSKKLWRFFCSRACGGGLSTATEILTTHAPRTMHVPPPSLLPTLELKHPSLGVGRASLERR